MFAIEVNLLLAAGSGFSGCDSGAVFNVLKALVVGREKELLVAPKVPNGEIFELA